MANTKVKAEQLEAAQTNITSLGTLTALQVDNVNINGNTISTTDTNGNLVITPNGTGNVNINTDTVAIMGAEGESAKLSLQADEADDNADIWSIISTTSNTLEIENNISGSAVAHMTFTPHATVASSTVTMPGRVLIGADSGDAFNADSMLRLQRTGDRVFIQIKTDTDQDSGILFGTTSDDVHHQIFHDVSEDKLLFKGQSNSTLTLTSSSFVGINDESPPRRLTIIGEDGAYSGQTSGNSRTHLLLENDGGNYIEFLNGASAAAGIFFSNNTAQNRGSVQYTGDALYLTQGGYDRAIIRPDGAFQTSDTNALIDFDSGGNRVRNGSLWGYTLRHEGTGSNPHGLLVLYNAASPDNSASYPFYFTDSSAARFYVSSDGNIWTSDHGSITSDETLKENIVDATPKLADIMKLKVRNFNWKKSYHPNSSEKMLGFIAQEFEEVFPSLIKETDIAPKTSAKDGEDHVPNMKKSVVTGALIPALVKGMQEQQALIETLQAEVKALKGG